MTFKTKMKILLGFLVIWSIVVLGATGFAVIEVKNNPNIVEMDIYNQNPEKYNPQVDKAMEIYQAFWIIDKPSHKLIRQLGYITAIFLDNPQEFKTIYTKSLISIQK